MSIRPFENKDSAVVEQLWKELFPDDPPYNELRKVIHDKMSVQKELRVRAKITSHFSILASAHI